MDTNSFLADLAGRGIELSLDGADLIAEPGRRLSDADRATIRAFKADLVARLRARPAETAARERTLANHPEASPDRPAPAIDSDNPAHDGPPPSTVESPPASAREARPVAKPAAARKAGGGVAAKPSSSAHCGLPTPAESLIGTCAKHGIILSVDEGGLWVGDTDHQPWPSLIMAIEAHRDAVAALVAAGWHLRADFPADFYIYIKNTENLQAVSIAL
jgi:hypothetical protein